MGTALAIALVAAPAITTFARPGHSSSSGDDLGIILVIGGVLVLVGALVAAGINASNKSKPVSPERLAQLQSEATALFDQMEAGKFTPPDTPLIMATDETALLNEPSKLIEARATRVYAGGGTRVKGIYIGGGQSTSVQRLKELDSGTLTLTTKRLIFTGSMESRVVNIKDIVSIEPFGADAFVVSTGRKAKRQVYPVRNPIIWGALLRTAIKGGISLRTKAPGLELREPAQLPHPESEPSAEIRFECTRCGQHLCVEQRGAGITVKCPHCNEQIEIPRQNFAT